MIGRRPISKTCTGLLRVCRERGQAQGVAQCPVWCGGRHASLHERNACGAACRGLNCEFLAKSGLPLLLLNQRSPDSSHAPSAARGHKARPLAQPAPASLSRLLPAQANATNATVGVASAASESDGIYTTYVIGAVAALVMVAMVRRAYVAHTSRKQCFR